MDESDFPLPDSALKQQTKLDIGECFDEITKSSLCASKDMKYAKMMSIRLAEHVATRDINIKVTAGRLLGEIDIELSEIGEVTEKTIGNIREFLKEL